MSKVYIGGELFTEADIAQRLKEGGSLKQMGFKVYNPIANDDINDKTELPTCADVFIQDTNEILNSDIITAPIDNEDSGLMFELGMVVGLQMFKDAVELTKGSLPKEYASILEKERKIYVVASDIRKDTAGNYDGIHVPKGYNQFVIGALEVAGAKFFNSFKELEEELAKWE